ncbi:MAG TPA: hypothetical protein ENG87_00650 [Candidatus Pacearchaeota archaeon]|nr:hypothetical protein BMS3Abin17_01262 [archaeon BMS3Abin17]HDK41858.1 hypothetical protein [Candidatus Pacearchaeota archaeon]HDZ60597.1 hypothetical protein [Candidatus Pacearchaeota archaeon]
MKRFKIKQKGIELYQAGLPHFPRNFTRDSIISTLLSGDNNMLKNQLIFCAIKQGKKNNPLTGEEPGKIHHESPGYKMPNGRFTDYNGCDTTGLYLIGLSSFPNLAKKQKGNIIRATDYILSHLDKKGVFIEDPKFCGDDKFGLKVTFWKDSAMVNRKDGQPIYPVVYPLAHIQNMCGLRSAAKLLDSKELKKKAELMANTLPELFDEKSGNFYLAIDKLGKIHGVSSDALHSLFYLNPEDLSKKQLEKIVKSSKVLETPIGYRTLAVKGVKYGDYDYSQQVWPFEQAIIHSGARKFGLPGIADVSSRIMNMLEKNSSPEIIIVDKKKFIKNSCDPQLWTLAAKKYFESNNIKK